MHNAPLTVGVAAEVLAEVAAAKAPATAAGLLPIGRVAGSEVGQPARHLLASLAQHLVQVPDRTKHDSSGRWCQKRLLESSLLWMLQQVSKLQ
jgi:hypothetical protein